MKPAGQVRVEFWQLHAHSKASQQFVFFTDSRRCAGHTGGDCWVHVSFLQTDGEKRLNWKRSDRNDLVTNNAESYHTREWADNSLGSSAPLSRRLHSEARQAGRNWPDRTLGS